MSIEDILIALLILMGIVMIIAEIFIIPGFGIAGIGGTVATVAGIVMVYRNYSPMAGHLTTAATLAVTGAAVTYVLTSKRGIGKMSLDTQIDSRAAADLTQTVAKGSRGVTRSRLNPMGKVEIDGKIYQAKCLTYLDAGTKVTVTDAETTTLVVEPLAAPEN